MNETQSRTKVNISVTSDTARVMVLLSGGLDSSACVAFFSKRNYHVEAMHFDYGQLAAKKEFKSAQAIAKHYKIKLHCRHLSAAQPKTIGKIAGRNAFLLFAALLEFPWESGLLAIGIHSGTPYFDCNKEFIKSAQHLINGYTDGRVMISAPFSMWEKSQIWDFCTETKVPLPLTWSCESGLPKPCGKCSSCKDSEVLFGK